MDVFGNVAFGLRMQRFSKADTAGRVRTLLEMVDMPGYAGRKVHELSGGERQRVALARALAPAPRLLMLDEPLGALDRVLRDSLQAQVRRILKDVGVSAIYVTHDRDEAFAMATSSPSWARAGSSSPGRRRRSLPLPVTSRWPGRLGSIT